MNQKLIQLHNQISQIHNYSQRFQHPSLIINRKSREKISKDISLVKKYYQSTWSNWYFYSIALNKCRILFSDPHKAFAKIDYNLEKKKEGTDYYYQEWGDINYKLFRN